MPRIRTAVLATSLCLLVAALAMAKPDNPTQNPFLTLTNPTSWDTRREFHIFAADFVQRGAGGNRQAFTSTLNMSSVMLVAPMITQCATAEINTDRFETTLSFENEVIDDTVELVPDLKCGEQIGLWEGANLRGRKMALKIKGPVRTFHTKINERAAASVQWPTNGFPEEVASCLEPQFFVESDDDKVVRLMNQLTANNPQGPPPYMVAKAIAGMIQQRFQPNGANIATDHPGRFGGLKIDGAAAVVSRMRGSEPDMAALLCAVYRAAGIPSRIVIGWDVAGSPGGRANVPAPDAVCRSLFDPDISSHALMRVWVEFYLYDEARQRGGWIPVDIYLMRQNSSRMGKLDREWAGFGGGLCFDHLIPVSFHFVPPSSVVASEDPALWGWATDPEHQPVDQELIFDAFPSIQRGGHR